MEWLERKPKRCAKEKEITKLDSVFEALLEKAEQAKSDGVDMAKIKPIVRQSFTHWQTERTAFDAVAMKRVDDKPLERLDKKLRLFDRAMAVLKDD